MGFRVHGALVHTHDYHQKPFKHSQDPSRGNGSHQQSGVGGEPLGPTGTNFQGYYNETTIAPTNVGMP